MVLTLKAGACRIDFEASRTKKMKIEQNLTSKIFRQLSAISQVTDSTCTFRAIGQHPQKKMEIFGKPFRKLSRNETSLQTDKSDIYVNFWIFWKTWCHSSANVKFFTNIVINLDYAKFCHNHDFPLSDPLFALVT